MVDVTSTAQPSDTPGPPKVVVPAQAVSGVLRDKSTLLQGAGLGPWRGVGGAQLVWAPSSQRWSFQRVLRWTWGCHQ